MSEVNGPKGAGGMLGPMTLLLAPNPPGDGRTLPRWLQSVGVGPAKILEPAEKGFIVDTQAGQLAFLSVAEPLPRQLVDEAVARSFWFNDSAPLEAHQAQLIIAPVSPPAGFHERMALAIMMTHLLCLSARHVEAAAVYNAAVGTLHSSPSLEQMHAVLGQGELPIALWTFTAPHSLTDGDVSLSTGGFAPLLGYEIEIWQAPLPVSEVHQRLNGLLRYLLANGPVIAHGDTIGHTETERAMRCFFGDSRVERNEPVPTMIVEFDLPPSDLPKPEAVATTATRSFWDRLFGRSS